MLFLLFYFKVDSDFCCYYCYDISGKIKNKTLKVRNIFIKFCVILGASRKMRFVLISIIIVLVFVTCISFCFLRLLKGAKYEGWLVHNDGKTKTSKTLSKSITYIVIRLSLRL